MNILKLNLYLSWGGIIHLNLITRVNMIQEHTYRDANGVERKQTDWGGTIVKGAGGAEGIAVGGSIIVMAAVGALVAGGFALLWFAIAGYEKFHSGTFGRLFAFVLAIAYGVMLYANFASGHPDLMIILYSNIAIAIFFMGAYSQKSQTTKYNDTVKKQEEELQSIHSKSEKIICSANGIILTEKQFIVEDKTYLISDIILAKMKKPITMIIAQLIILIVAYIIGKDFYEMGVYTDGYGYNTNQILYMMLMGLMGIVLLFLTRKRVLLLDLKSAGVKKVLVDRNVEAISGFVDSINKLVKKNNT